MTRKLSLIAASFVVATALFGARMLTSPPVSEAATNPGINVGQIAFNAPENLPSFDDTYQRAYRRARHAPPLSEAAPNHAGLRHRGTQALAAPFGRLLETAAGGLPPPRAGC